VQSHLSQLQLSFVFNFIYISFD